MFTFKKLLFILGIISFSNEPSAFESIKNESKHIQTPKELSLKNKISQAQYESILKSLNELENMTEKEKSEFYKKMIKNGVFITAPTQPCKSCDC